MSDDIAQITFRAPDRLVEWLAKEGFTVELSLTRADVMTIDPSAYPPDADEAFTDLEKKQIDGIIAAYDATEPWDPKPEEA